MFGKLRGKIYLTMFVLPTAFVVLLSSLTFGFVHDYLSDDYKNAASESVSLASTNFNFYMDILSSDLNLLADDSAVVNYAQSATSPVVAQNKLNAAVNSDASILGVTLYGTAANIHLASTGVSGYSLLSELETDDPIGDFLNSPQNELLLLRNRFIPDNFDFVSYDESYGILSYFLKIQEGGTFRGLLVADLDSEYLYSTFFNYDKYESFKQVTSLITDGTVFLKSQNNAAMDAWITRDLTETLTTVDSQNSYLRTSLLGGYDLVTVIDDAYRTSQSLFLGLSIVAMDTLLIALALFITRKEAKRILSPLFEIVDKMKNQNVN